MKENTSPINKQGGDKKRKLEKEDEYYSRINEVNEGITFIKKIQIFLSSHKNITYSYIFVSYLFPLLLLFATLFISSAGDSILNYLNSTIFGPFESVEYLNQKIFVFFGQYINYVNLLFIFDLLSFGYLDINHIYLYLNQFFSNIDTLSENQINFFSLLTLGFISFIWNFSFWLIVSKIFIPKSSWQGKGNLIEYYTDKLQKEISKSSTLIDSKLKSGAMKKVSKYKKDILNELKKSTDKEGKILDFMKLLQVLPAYKIALQNKDSIFGNGIANFANKRWIIHVKEQTTIENFMELKTFLLVSQFGEEQQQIIHNLNWEAPIEEIFPNNKEDNDKLIENLSKNIKLKNKYTKHMMQYLMVIKFFKNYPIYSAIRFLDSVGIKFNETQTAILVSSRKIILNQLNEPNKILDLTLDLTLPNIKDKKVKKELIVAYSDFINSNNNKMALLENAAETEVLWEPDTDFKRKLKEYHQEYIKILSFFIKTVFVNYNMEYGDYFEDNITEAFFDFFEVDDTQSALLQIASFKVIKLEDFYSMLDMVMKRETIYDKKIVPLYFEYFNQLKIKNILYHKKG